MSGFAFQDPGGCNCPGSCTCSTTICVQACGGSAISGATVTISSLAPVTTGSGGCTNGICLDSVGGAGTYQVTVSASGYNSYNQSLALTCGGTKTIQLTTGTTGSVVFNVAGCEGKPLANATVTIAGATYTTSAGGTVTVYLSGSGTYPFAVTKLRWQTSSGNVVFSTNCPGQQTVNITMAVASGYVCCYGPGSAGLADPIATTLSLTDAVYGSTTLTYSGGQWTGTITGASFAGGCTCPAGTTNITYFFGSNNGSAPCYVYQIEFKAQNAFGGSPPYGCPDASGTISPTDISGTSGVSLSGPPLLSEVTYGPCSSGPNLYPSASLITVTD